MQAPERRSLKLAAATAAALLLVVTVASLRSRPAAMAQTREGAGHYDIKPSQLPSPGATRSSSNPPRMVPQPANAKLTLPPGFEISTWAEGDLENPRWLALAPNGDVFLADSESGRILVFRDPRNAGKATERFVFAADLQSPFGMAFHGGYRHNS